MLKKFILFLAMIFSLLPLFFHQAQAHEVQSAQEVEGNIITYFYNDSFNSQDCLYLNSGYYIISAYDSLSKNEIVGNVEFYTFEATGQADPEDYYRYRDYDENDVALINELFAYYTKKVVPTSMSYHFIIVKSCAILKNDTIYDNGFFTVMHAPKKPENKKLTFIGNKTHVVNVDNFISIEGLKARYTANDNVDGDVTSTMTFYTNYNPGEKKVGRFYFVAVASDRSGHKTISLDYVMVIDFTPPVVSLSQEVVRIEVFTAFTTEDAKALFSVTDNFVSKEKIRWIVEDQYKNNYNTLGTYYFTMSASDGKNRSDSKRLTIIVEDTTKPTLKLKNEQDKIIADHQLSNEELLDYFVVEDNYDQLSKDNLEIVENNCTGQEGKDFIVKVKATDLSGNELIKEFKYYLLDTKAPIITVKDTIFLESNKEYTNEQIIEMLKQSGILDFEVVATKWQLISENDFETVYEATFTSDTHEKKVLINIAKETTFKKTNNCKLIISVGAAICGITLLSLLIIRKKKHRA